MQESGLTKKKPPRVGNITAFFMILIAFVLDLVQFLFVWIPGVDVVVGYLAAFFALCGFGVWFAVLRVNYFSGKRSGAKVLSLFTGTAVELIPIIDALPAITAGVIGIIVSSRSEDALESKTVALSRKPSKTQRVQKVQESRATTAANDNHLEEERLTA
jgi:hypothetical protein